MLKQRSRSNGWLVSGSFIGEIVGLHLAYPDVFLADVEGISDGNLTKDHIGVAVSRNEVIVVISARYSVAALQIPNRGVYDKAVIEEAFIHPAVNFDKRVLYGIVSAVFAHEVCTAIYLPILGQVEVYPCRGIAAPIGAPAVLAGGFVVAGNFLPWL